MGKSRSFSLHHAGKTVAVHFLSNDEINSASGREMEEREYLYGFYSGKRNAIFINQETPNHFSTLLHEVMEYVKNDYGLDSFSHEHLSLISEVLSQVLQQNWKKLDKQFFKGA